ncbi:cytochrome b-245 heavy chain [Aplysia californica]|uniref:Cytochrome b-245 heavy chain n=1 Tax=Aplysia californica TaxID=6500 RepID=A0ABM0JCP1_APLCA|nr:cytochrome b-245 heavy chain [Aplysia californica]
MIKWNKNDAPRWIFVGIWIIINVILFAVTFVSYRDADEYFYLRSLVGNSLCWARASAACLNFNVMLILLPVCRKLFSYIRGCCDCCPQILRRQLDKNITYHKYIAYMICLHTAIHISAHCFNFEKLAEAHRITGNDLRSRLTHLPSSPNGTWVNPIRSSDPDPTREVFKSVAGVSGVIITLCLIIIVSSSTEIIRRSYFEVFWFTHHVFIIFFIGFLVHGAQMIIHKQSNLSNHPVPSCSEKRWDGKPCDVPQFEGTPPASWKWLVAPAILYLLERLARLVSGLTRVVITKVVTHPSQVFELQMQKKGFRAAPGQYILIQCPAVSKLEWHPFTLTSAPGDEYFSVHVRRVGDWTEAVAKLCHVDEGDFQEAWKMPRIYVDGPFGTATEDVFGYDVALLVGCGIGVTPFASVLKSVWYKFCDPKATVSLKKVYLYWVCPDTSAFEWFQGLLLDLERQMRQKNMPDFLQYNIHLTRGWNANQARNIMLHDDFSDYDAVTGLHHKTQYGRPQWETIFKEQAESHKGERIGVFFCGPKSLSSTLHKHCNRFSSSESKTYFYYNKENF